MKFLPIRQVMQATGLSRMTTYCLELASKFPKSRQLSENSVACLESDIAARADTAPHRALERHASERNASHRLSCEWRCDGPRIAGEERSRARF